VPKIKKPSRSTAELNVIVERRKLFARSASIAVTGALTLALGGLSVHFATTSANPEDYLEEAIVDALEDKIEATTNLVEEFKAADTFFSVEISKDSANQHAQTKALGKDYQTNVGAVILGAGTVFAAGMTTLNVFRRRRNIRALEQARAALNNNEPSPLA